ncbi:RluA family pseudouridine synthase [Portibacter lacus]|uniref:RNA pseudouridine synthase n=1 Tax=Portibacter lacus TaxID=1099794 RepID=A0AA37WFC1_9BACT|nr:RluA family pseudouridine synthase [Portibacter lacus]GLR18402.1 RNA pseudouridine synthase [Portibacter lacus]
MAKIDVVFEDNHLIAINKKGGDLSQKDKSNDDSLIEHIKLYIKEKFKKPGDVFLGSIHRLDRPTSGVIVYARTSKALTRMTKLFRDNDIKKSYFALVEGRPPDLSGYLKDYLKKDPIKNKSYIAKKGAANAKLAELKYEFIREVDNRYLIKLDLMTGRHHQIRVQLANIGCRIVGDLKYGYGTPNADKSICLHCSEIVFVHPVKKVEIRISARVPKIPEWKGVKGY